LMEDAQQASRHRLVPSIASGHQSL
jgi:hypothetical protein